MNDLRNLTAIWLIVSLFHFSSLQAATPPNEASMKEKVDFFGVGAKVKLRLADGEKLRGSIETITGETFALTPRPGAPQRQIAYDQVADLQLAKRVYRAHDQPDPVEAKRVVAALGVGKHVMVKTTGGKEFHGHIQAIEPDHFTLLPDREVGPQQGISHPRITRIHTNEESSVLVPRLVCFMGYIRCVRIPTCADDRS